jgi:hypothetical protein
MSGLVHGALLLFFVGERFPEVARGSVVIFLWVQ